MREKWMRENEARAKISTLKVVNKMLTELVILIYVLIFFNF